ncbi:MULTISPECIES: CPBP family glutamic-type intramembrane protease [Mycolicibacterium]|uniref:Abortive infection protein n=1 Tax=Mycolicibacterium vanbaalenii (strain DSM 7251 / JCM 13017 / BCRC 16820 / KCTC 9966 / NRRL B-24157 / PYR-1) TaxID=350058 RepID=A1THM2_MYCVP|nr:CPBP family glutamic-type intramembrane protease [Mycolicibacterium vanbaalenii]ABM16672.1 Abortive infection protein [Mycolicibacterium vanbaalenii PYR-1]MCV7130979.1 CPBP family intramembrane metalloprotease [Mycolicibacterium vanbaalenii PYR-1]
MGNAPPTAFRDPITNALRESPEQRRRGVRWFLAIAFLGAWIPWAAVHSLGGSLDDPLTQLATAAFVPAIAACVVRRWITGQGFADSGLRLNWRSSWMYCIAATTIPWAVLLLAVAVAIVAGWWSPTELDMSVTAWVYLAAGPVVCVATAPIFWGEEYGWTAYLRDRLVPGRPIATTFLTGLIWGVWHWPLPWVGYFGGETPVAEAIWSMVWWLPLSILLEFLIGLLWSATASVWPGAMLHAGSNLVASVGMLHVFGDAVGINATTFLLCVGLLPFVAVIVVSRYPGRPRLA